MSESKEVSVYRQPANYMTAKIRRSLHAINKMKTSREIKSSIIKLKIKAKKDEKLAEEEFQNTIRPFVEEQRIKRDAKLIEIRANLAREKATLQLQLKSLNAVIITPQVKDIDEEEWIQSRDIDTDFDEE